MRGTSSRDKMGYVRRVPWVRNLDRSYTKVVSSLVYTRSYVWSVEQNSRGASPPHDEPPTLVPSRLTPNTYSLPLRSRGRQDQLRPRRQARPERSSSTSTPACRGRPPRDRCGSCSGSPDPRRQHPTVGGRHDNNTTIGPRSSTQEGGGRRSRRGEGMRVN